MLSTLVAVVLAQSCPDLGDGTAGPLTVASGAVRINDALALRQSVAAGQSTVTVAVGAAPLPVPGSLVLLHQVQRQTAGGVNAPNLFSATAIGVGHFEFARVASVTADTVTFTAPLQQAFTEPRAQLITVPQYTSVTIAAGASLVPPAWDGTAGGVLVLVASGDVQLDGELEARGKGFRGGAAVHVADARNDAGVCTAGGEAGESFDFSGPVVEPLGTWSGGGGGHCTDNGGGGGANGGAGGNGGVDRYAVSDGIAASRGGSAVSVTATQAVFGGGGGGGLGDLVAQVATAGGAGGGVVIVRARSLRGAGRVVVDGESAAPSLLNGAGGGGAGGTILLELETSLGCGGLFARGGAGGATAVDHGVGGGGAGGAIRIRAGQVLDCPRDLSAGLAGAWPDGGREQGGPTSALDPRSVGVTVLELRGDAGCAAQVVGGAELTIRKPAADEVLVGPPYCFDGTSTAHSVRGSVDGVALETSPVQPTQQWRLCTDQALAAGAHVLVVQALDGNGQQVAEASANFRTRGEQLAVGCGCGSTGSLVALAAILGLRASLRSRRRGA